MVSRFEETYIKIASCLLRFGACNRGAFGVRMFDGAVELFDG